MKFHIARTCAVNPPGVALPLTRTQVWEALKTRLRTHRKSSIRDLEVVEEHDSGLTRTYHRKGIGGKMREVITFDNDVKITIQAETLRSEDNRLLHGIYSSIVLSGGEGDSDLYLTYSFTYEQPCGEMAKGAKAEKERTLRTASRLVLQQMLEEVRALVREKGIAGVSHPLQG